MALYTFFPTTDDGASNSLEAVELAGHHEAGAQARRVLDEHDSAAQVRVFCGDRHVLTHSRS